jgi:hypothetical protein
MRAMLLIMSIISQHEVLLYLYATVVKSVQTS